MTVFRPRVHLIVMMLRDIVAVCTCARSLESWTSPNSSSLFTVMVPSLLRTITAPESARWDIRLYVGIDDDDAFFQKHLESPPTDWPVTIVTTSPRRLNRVPFNENAAVAYADQAEYYVRVNDDTEFLSPGWLTMGVAALGKMGNVGVVGPRCDDGNTAILTHDMTHRTHLDMFDGLYYAAEFSAWWVDDWITKVYAPSRMEVLGDWKVAHHIAMHGTRYAVQHNEKRLLNEAIKRGAETVANWLTRPLKLLLFVTTHSSAQHLEFMRAVWPTQVAPLLLTSDVLFYAPEAAPLPFKQLFSERFTEVTCTNPGYQAGAIMAMKFLQEHRNYTTGYDWVIRLNPDVIIRNTDWIETTMENANVDGIFADCYSSGCESHCAKGLIHTDLTIFRPRSLPFGVLDITNAERYATALFQTVVDRGRDRWIPQTTQYGVCRVNSPHVVHNHSILTDN